MYQLRQTEYLKPLTTSYGFRYNAGDTLDAGLIASQSGAAQVHYGYTFTLSGATSTILSYSAIVAGVLTTMF